MMTRPIPSEALNVVRNEASLSMSHAKAVEVVMAYGHPNVTALHMTTFEITKEPFLSKRGDCIIAVKADKGAVDLSPQFKSIAQRDSARVTITIEVDGLKETIEALGSSRLTFTRPFSIVVRKSDYACGRTIAIRADKAARDLSRNLVGRLRDPTKVVKITLTAEFRGR